MYLREMEDSCGRECGNGWRRCRDENKGKVDTKISEISQTPRKCHIYILHKSKRRLPGRRKTVFSIPSNSDSYSLYGLPHLSSTKKVEHLQNLIIFASADLILLKTMASDFLSINFLLHFETAD